mgnify:CR=1 FL=1
MKPYGKCRYYCLTAFVLAVSAGPVGADESSRTNIPSGDVLLLDSVGRIVKVPANEISSGLRPPAALGLKHQIPEPTKGASQPDTVQQRTQEGRKEKEGLQKYQA